MTLTSPAPTDTAVLERRLEAMRADLKLHFKECGPRFLRNPNYGERFFIIAAKGTVLDEPECAIAGPIHRSALTEAVTERELAEYIRILNNEGYRLKLCMKGGSKIRGQWIKYKAIYYRGDTK